MNTFRALIWLTAAFSTRLLRDGLVRRSVVWPAGLVVGTLVAVLFVSTLYQPTSFVLVPVDAPPALLEQLEADGFRPVPHHDPERKLMQGAGWAATDGETLWIDGFGPKTREVEASIRRYRDSDWVPYIERPDDAGNGGDMLGQLLALLFALYGVVFGLGSAVRDRNDGSLATELSLPIPRWVPGLSRWLGSSMVLAGFYVWSVACVAAVLGISDVQPVLRNGIAACTATTAIGIASAGRASMRQSFSGAFTIAASATLGLVVLGRNIRWLGDHVALASLFSESDGWIPLASCLGFGALAAISFAFRAARD